ncbi:F-box only protein 40 [Lampris incognitus]|uniref:F-box only protein 40 n=1 Tax=Lampris incognitus TaxID=2546036 RepID=UPI0024B55CC2|nr:F-box only protein 40 [Lampris incognitus]
MSSDASNSGNIKLFPYTVQYFKETEGVQYGLLDFYEDADGTSGAVYQQIVDVTERNGLSTRQISACGVDKASVNHGKQQFFRSYQKLNPKIVEGNCKGQSLWGETESLATALDLGFDEDRLYHDVGILNEVISSMIPKDVCCVKVEIPAGRHEHCDRCHDVHCQVQVKVSVSCLVIKCRKNCGAVLHMCKEEEHLLLCPNEKVPCLNAGYGCPLSMPRHRLAKHLEVCPASVVCCSQEWNRWPVTDTDKAFYRNVSGDSQIAEGHLDVAMALRDQELLFRSIKMKNVFPELLEVLSEPVLEDMAVGGTGGAFDDGGFTENGCFRMEDKELSEEEREALAKNSDLESIQNFSCWEGIFRKEMEGCKQTVKNLNRVTDSGGAKEEKDSPRNRSETSNLGQSQENTCAASVATGTTGLAPWQDGVLERLGKEFNIAEYNMYLVHNGAMLINFGQLAACTPREKDFVYGNLEPIEVQTVRSFNVPTSYRAKRNHLKDPSRKAQSAHRSVDTADSGVVTEDLPKSDEVSAALLCSLERELRGHLISESVGTDGFYVDVGTQTYDFSLAPFNTDASLADVIADKPKGLYLNIQAESVTRRHNKTTSAFSYICGHFFRRDEYHSHFRNVHSDIQACLNGWFEQRCPLAYLGCTYIQSRFLPSGQHATVQYCQDLNTFALRPEVFSSHLEGGKSLSPQRKRARNIDPLSRMPFEILQHIASYLDSFTLSQLSQVSRLMREVCATLLQQRGMVSLKWEKKKYSHGGTSWKCRKKAWGFSCLFSPVDRWCFSSIPSMSEHLKACSFYQREERAEPVALPSFGEVTQKRGRVNHQC